MMINNDIFWLRLKQTLKIHNYTMKQLSSELGYNEKTLNVKQSNNVLPTTSDIIRICNMFNVSADYLLLGIEPKIPQETIDLAGKIHALPVQMQNTVISLISNLEGVTNDNTK